jgi:hypothetical protein
LTVSTYANADPADPSGGRLKAQTRITPSGDIESHLSSDPADAQLLEIHARIVGEALRSRRGP